MPVRRHAVRLASGRTVRVRFVSALKTRPRFFGWPGYLLTPRR
jgi:hypothetical protein